MATATTIKPIEAKSVHQIQSGQVIVDLCSVVKELVENSLDAGATSVEVRFKNSGLDAIEIQDNGSGIAASNYQNVALKHYTSKLLNYDDLSTLQTFGFRGEALSSLCALSHFAIVTAQAHEVPKGSRLEFEASGELKSTTTTACQRGTTAIVDGLFNALPVRRKELSKNIKREYGKVLGLLHAYACVGVNVKFTVKNTIPKGKTMTVFSTKGNATTRENIANVYGAKTLQALASLDLNLDSPPSLNNVKVVGHISRPVFGDGRQTPDRQMFFVNGRPCGLPQIAKAINEVYKSFNMSQSPFIFADFIMDTNAYDVNVSPDKRSIMLHNAASLVERLKTSLSDMFDQHEQTMPQSQVTGPRLPAFRQLSMQRQSTTGIGLSQPPPSSSVALRSSSRPEDNTLSLNNSSNDDELGPKRGIASAFQLDGQRRTKPVAAFDLDEDDRAQDLNEDSPNEGVADLHHINVRDFNKRISEQQDTRSRTEDAEVSEQPILTVSSLLAKEPRGVVQNAFERMRPKRTKAEIATITVDGETTTTVIGSQFSRDEDSFKRARLNRPLPSKRNIDISARVAAFPQSLGQFGAPRTQIGHDDDVEDDIVEEEDQGQASVLASSESTEEEHEDANSVVDESKKSDDSDYVDDSEKKAREEARVAELIWQAEESAAGPSKENVRRANKALKGGRTRHSTFNLVASIDTSLGQLRKDMAILQPTERDRQSASVEHEKIEAAAKDEEARLSLTVSKADFARMRVVGQFNLGFILAVRPKAEASGDGDHTKDELFIIDQHASDEKFNFERLQAETVIGNQPMVRPVTLSLTAVEEEILLENPIALEKNGFVVETDTSGASPVGRRCTLTSLPVSKETTFDTRDMDELIHMLAEAPMLGTESSVPRPSRVRKMFAMRACRSSIMIGKTLSQKQMATVVRHMGTIDKPWNCPHGRPTMRHLTSLGNVETWQEAEGLADSHTTMEAIASGEAGVWQTYIAGTRGYSSLASLTRTPVTAPPVASAAKQFAMAPLNRAKPPAVEFRDKEEYHEDPSKGAMLRFEDSLPRLPVPSLAETSRKYLKSLHPLLSKEEYAASEKAVAEFNEEGGIGQKLQERLIARAEDPNTKNWISDWWNEAAYLGYRDPVVPYVSYFYSFRDDRKRRNPAKRAAAITTAALEFKRQVDTKSLEPEYMRKAPMAMSSYQYMFNCSRVAAVPSDYPIVYGSEGNEHIIVIRKNQFWKVPTQVNGKQLNTSEFEHQFNHIYTQSEPSPPIGALTSLPRDQGAKAREHLLAASPSNAHALKEVESSAFVVNLDNATPITLEERSRSYWHGDGENRWYDKPVQFIINDNGTAGFQGEHSMMDGTPTHRLCDTLNALIVQRKLDFDNPTVRSTLPPPTIVHFDVDANVAEDIAQAQKQFAQVIASQDLRVQAYQGYGKGLIKKFKCSPDAYVQVLIQLAYHKMYGKNRPTYESGATRKYQLGRTETVRSVTDESVDFCNAMANAQVPRAELERLFRAAVAVQVKNTQESSEGHGVDRHLFGLKKSLAPGEEVPALFTDPAYAYSSTWFISSSQLSSEYYNGYGWSQVVDAGWGLAYMINEDSLQFNVVSKRLGCDRMSFFLNEAASEIRNILLPSLAPPKAKL
ncbi:hypothetical protein DV736_g2354, partial [Chaetothyriales sp. CBS 134916]